jgi:hypothetical protein
LWWLGTAGDAAPPAALAGAGAFCVLCVRLLSGAEAVALDRLTSLPCLPGLGGSSSCCWRAELGAASHAPPPPLLLLPALLPRAPVAPLIGSSLGVAVVPLLRPRCIGGTALGAERIGHRASVVLDLLPKGPLAPLRGDPPTLAAAGSADSLAGLVSLCWCASGAWPCMRWSSCCSSASRAASSRDRREACCRCCCCCCRCCCCCCCCCRCCCRCWGCCCCRCWGCCCCCMCCGPSCGVRIGFKLVAARTAPLLLAEGLVGGSWLVDLTWASCTPATTLAIPDAAVAAACLLLVLLTGAGCTAGL